MSNLYKSVKADRTTVVTLLQAEISMDENEGLKKDLYTLLDLDGGNILINLSKIVFISSVLLATLVGLLKKAKELGKTICLCSLRDPVKQIFEITGIIKLFEVYNTEEMALARLKSK